MTSTGNFFWPSSQRAEPALDAGERDMLCGWLDYFRDTIVRKLDGLDEEAVRRRLVPSLTTLLGMVKHLTYAEEGWFWEFFAGRERTLPSGPEDDFDFLLTGQDTIESVVARYREQVERSRRIVAFADLDDHAAVDRDTRRGPSKDFTLRWILTHMIEETARHCGHADVLRELIDGRTGK